MDAMCIYFAYQGIAAIFTAALIRQGVKAGLEAFFSN